MRAVLLSGFLAGSLDLLATLTLMSTQGVRIQRVLQFIASGAFGTAAFEGGSRMAAAGLLFHFFIAGSVAWFYYWASMFLPVTVEHPWLCGILYGAGVHLVMSFVVVPLSRTVKKKFSEKAFLTQLAIHMFCVGLPIALTQNWLMR